MTGGTSIPTSEWSPFLERFTMEHCGQEVDVETVGPDMSRPIAVRLPLIRVSAERRPGEEGQIDLRAGDSTGTIREAIREPTKIEVSEWDGGRSAELRVESRNGVAVRVRVMPSSSAWSQSQSQ